MGGTARWNWILSGHSSDTGSWIVSYAVDLALTQYCLSQNEGDLAEELVGFMQQFLEVFSELKGNKLYLSGESVCSQTLSPCSFSERHPLV